eukprot:CAMPEP_0198132902 /NCGR_PEP_ID=MMETSP1442-20131203/59290_1 /TAXON_ID= /ORGANISM="Craspedostauros australis, Strain CCMP3328" /LENGTH=77 /DNA_ID=CAMNT_0043794005 /DNA_START=1059 /DNA_END=1292 /DNA_ORIENTATION=+
MVPSPVVMDCECRDNCTSVLRCLIGCHDGANVRVDGVVSELLDGIDGGKRTSQKNTAQAVVPYFAIKRQWRRLREHS